MPQSNEYMLKQDDAELIYQKKLTAGTNITIDPITNTISSTGGGGSSVSYSGSLPQGYGDTIGIITIDGTQYPIKVRNLIQGSNINIVQDMATGNLTISSTAQGTHVEANPSDPATARLSTIEIGSIVYDIHSDNVIIGEQAPSSSQGENGDIYIKINTIETPTGNHTCPYYISYNCCSSYSSNFDANAKIQGFNSRVYATTLGWIYGAVWNSLTVGNLYKLSINTTFGSVPSLNDSNELFGAVVQSYNGAIDGDAITGGVAQDGEFAEYDDETYGKFFYQSFHEDAASGSYSFTFVADTSTPICAIYMDKLNAGTSFDVSNWKLEEIELSYEIDKIYYKINGDWIEDTTGGTTYTAGTNIQISPQNVISATDTTYDVFEAPETAQDTGVDGLVPAPTYADVQANKVLQADGTWVPQSGGGGGNVADVYVNGTSVLDANDIAQVFSHEEITEINYDNLPSTKFSDNHMYLIKEAGTPPTGEYYNPVIYSEEEREIGVWVDDKPLYAKTYSFNSFVRITNSGADISQYIDNRNDIDTLVRGESFCTDGTSSAAIQSTALWVGYSTRGVILAYCSEGATANYVTLHYTKTTDTAGSGQYNHLGISTVHYSTDEQVIGTWINGKPLYQKTLDVGVLPNNNTKLVSIDSNIDLIINYDGFAYSTTDRTYQRPLPMVGSSNAIIRIDRNGNDLRIITYDNWTTYTGFVTIQYTKTTD